MHIGQLLVHFALGFEQLPQLVVGILLEIVLRRALGSVLRSFIVSLAIGGEGGEHGGDGADNGFVMCTTRTRPHISHSESTPLLRKVHRPHSHLAGPWATRGVPASPDLCWAIETLRSICADGGSCDRMLLGGGPTTGSCDIPPSIFLFL